MAAPADPPKKKARKRRVATTGAPPRMTAETVAAIIKALESGATLKIAAEAAGICDRTLTEWLAKGRAPHPRPVMARFLRDVTRARARNATNMLDIIVAAAPTDWRAAAWMLERLHGIVKELRIEVGGDVLPDDPLSKALARALERREKQDVKAGNA